MKQEGVGNGLHEAWLPPVVNQKKAAGRTGSLLGVCVNDEDLGIAALCVEEQREKLTF